MPPCSAGNILLNPSFELGSLDGTSYSGSGSFSNPAADWTASNNTPVETDPIPPPTLPDGVRLMPAVQRAMEQIMALFRTGLRWQTSTLERGFTSTAEARIYWHAAEPVRVSLSSTQRRTNGYIFPSPHDRCGMKSSSFIPLLRGDLRLRFRLAIRSCGSCRNCARLIGTSAFASAHRSARSAYCGYDPHRSENYLDLC